MAKGTKFTFTTAEGKVETRTSARAYTHVVVGRRDLAQLRAHARSKYSVNHHLHHWDYSNLCAQTAPGEPYPETGVSGFPVTQDMHDTGKALVTEYPTSQAYADAKVQGELASIAEEYGTGDEGPETVLQWSQSARAAHASVGSHSKFYVQVRVVELKTE